MQAFGTILLIAWLGTFGYLGARARRRQGGSVFRGALAGLAFGPIGVAYVANTDGTTLFPPFRFADRRVRGGIALTDREPRWLWVPVGWLRAALAVLSYATGVVASIFMVMLGLALVIVGFVLSLLDDDRTWSPTPLFTPKADPDEPLPHRVSDRHKGRHTTAGSLPFGLGSSIHTVTLRGEDGHEHQGRGWTREQASDAARREARRM